MSLVGFQGVAGAYSDEAAHHLFPEAETLGFPTFSEVFDAVASEVVTAGVLPVENTVAGVVQEVSDLLWTHETVHAVGEHVSPIRHVLMTTSDGPVRRALSHPQALAQCAEWLEANGIESVAFYDTAGAAAEIARSGQEGDGAIASRAAAERYGLRVVVTDIANSDTNRTRFLILKSEPGVRGDPAGPNKIVLGFTTDHRPGALAEVMGVFTACSANLTRLDSRPVPHQPFRYRFYADCEVDGTRVAGLVSSLKAAAKEIRVFGCFESSEPSLTLWQDKASGSH